MKISIKELSKYVDIAGLSPLEIASKLTFAGIEVEEVSTFASGTNLIIGKVVSCEKHPDSDHLHVLKVDIGSKILNIVCGAPNARNNIKVIVAQVGAKLPEIDIKEGIIRGVKSEGMCCSLLELGVDKKYLSEEEINGIEVLDDSAPIGETNVLGFLGLDDTILDLKPLANRPDANSIYGVALEVGTLFKRKVNIPTPNLSKLKVINEKFFVGSESDNCLKFTIRIVRGVHVKESPKWLKDVLSSSGIRSINNIVDIGNYVMLLTGQPLHMYDLDKLGKKELIVKDNIEQNFVGLDEMTYKLCKGDLCIVSNNNVECLAGVLGSLHSETTDKTKNVVIEAAIFDSKSIRLTSNRLGLVSESSNRFTKGISKFVQEDALNLAASLLESLAGAISVSEIYKYQKEEFLPLTIKCSFSYINKRLGSEFASQTIVDTLESLHFAIKIIDKDEFIATVPAHRIDVTGKADLSEEVIRVLGYDNINAHLPLMDMTVGHESLNKEKTEIIENYLIDNGFYETLSYSLVNKKQSEEFALLNNKEVIKVLNPLTDDHEYVRRCLLPSLLGTISFNANRKQKDFKVFEISNVYSKNYMAKHIALGCYGSELYQGQLVKYQFNFYTLKGIFENICSLFGIEESRYKFIKVEDNNSYFHPGKSAYIVVNGKTIGVVGELHPHTLKEYDLKNNLVVMEFNLDKIIELKSKDVKSTPVSKFPPVERDLAFTIDKNVEANKIISQIKKTAAVYSPDVSIFDIYQGDNIDASLKSIAVNVILNPLDETLKDDEINAIIAKVMEDLSISFGAKLR